MCYTSQLGWGNSILCYYYYQRLPNQIQDPVSIWKQGKSILFQNMYALAMTTDHLYWECNCKFHYARQAEKETFESHSQKQGKASTAGNSTASQNKASYLCPNSCPLLLRNNLILYG